MRRLCAAPRSAELRKRQREKIRERAWECCALGLGESPALPRPSMPHPGPSRAGKGPGVIPALPHPGPAAPRARPGEQQRCLTLSERFSLLVGPVGFSPWQTQLALI